MHFGLPVTHMVTLDSGSRELSSAEADGLLPGQAGRGDAMAAGRVHRAVWVGRDPQRSMMVDVVAVEAWFEGGPVAGQRVLVEVAADGELLTVVMLPQTDIYVGSSDVPAPAVEHRYVLVAGSSLEVTYRYDGSVELPS
jgi:hypothetical protein